MFYLSHEEFSHSQETRARSNFIAEGLPNRRRSEGHRVLVELKELFEVKELTLCSFGAEISRGDARRTEGGFKHEVKGNRGEDFVVPVRVSNIQSSDQRTKIRSLKVVDLTSP
jgi:hypothetical protein